MAYQRKTRNATELSAALSAAALGRKKNNGRRPKGSKNKVPSKRTPTRTMTVRESDYEVFRAAARAAAVPIVEFMHLNAEGLKRRNPQIFGPTPEIDP